jgi:threonine aldolase
VRRQRGEQFDFGEMTRISKWARERGVGLHLDGARLFVESAYSGRSLKEYGALFDTVYISMYKYFNAAGGAVLAGPKKLLDGLYHTRRMFGGGVYRQWPAAAVALHFLQGFEERFRKAVAASEAVITSLSRDPAFEVERVKNGTNIFAIRTPVANAAVYNVRLQEQGVEVRTVRGQQLVVQVNETWAWVEVEDLAKRFRTALG